MVIFVEVFLSELFLLSNMNVDLVYEEETLYS